MFTKEELPNGILVFLDPDTGKWMLSVNRFVTKVITQEIYAGLLDQAKEFLQEAKAQGLPVVDPDDDEAVAERLPQVGEEVRELQSLNRELEGGLEEAAYILPKLWGWIVGIDDTPWEPSDEEQ